VQVTLKISVPSSNAHPPKVSGQLIVGLSGTRSDSDFFSDPLALEGATTEHGAVLEVPDGSLFVVVVQRVNHHACDLRVLFRADGGHGEAALDPIEQTQVVARGASVVVAAKPESKWGASWAPLFAVLKDIFPVTRKRPAGAHTQGAAQFPNMGLVQYRCPNCDCAIDRGTGSGHAPGCTFSV
jgi:hypothetical protein